MTRYFISVGEASGDLHAAPLIRELKSKDPNAQILGIAGPMMRQEGIDELLPMEHLQVMGFIEIALAFPRLYRIFQKVKSTILLTQVDIVICVDYPGFHLKLAEKLRKEGFKGKIIQYVSPTVWAHGKNRIAKLEKHFDQLLCILPFEPAYFSKSSLKVNYVGHPLVEKLSHYSYDENWKIKCGIDLNKPILALFPGSRPSEIKNHLAVMQEAAKGWEGQVVISGKGGIPREFTYELMRDCTAAIAKSGTVTLELALHHKPAVVIYRTSRINRWIAKHILKLDKLPYFCLVNILANKELYPEFIRKEFTSECLQKALFSLNTHLIQNECRTLHESLGTYPSSKLAAEVISPC